MTGVERIQATFAQARKEKRAAFMPYQAMGYPNRGDTLAIVTALADKLYNLVGFFGIDERPTGSRDPYAMRRAALGVEPQPAVTGAVVLLDGPPTEREHRPHDVQDQCGDIHPMTSDPRVDICSVAHIS